MRPFHLKFWGEIENDGYANEYFGDQRDFWFETRVERRRFREKLQRIADAANRFVAVKETEGALCEYRTVAVMNLTVCCLKWRLEHDFGYGYEWHYAEFMFFEGNYSCDCNKGIFLNAEYPFLNLDEECGEEIELTDWRIEYRPRPGLLERMGDK